MSGRGSESYRKNLHPIDSIKLRIFIFAKSLNQSSRGSRSYYGIGDAVPLQALSCLLYAHDATTSSETERSG